MSITRLAVKNEILKRPKFVNIADSTTLKAVIDQAIQQALYEYYEAQRSLPLLERTNAPDGLTLPAGVAWGANGKIYVLDSTTTPVLPADVDRITKLWIKDGSTGIMYSSSTYDTDTEGGSGIPESSSAALSVTNVYHEYYAQDTDRKLIIYAGSTAAGATPKVCLNWVTDMVVPSSDSDKLMIADTHLISVFTPLLDKWLLYYLGFNY